ncbi:MAG: insulinase family protein [Spirochaetes bacterium]|nr:insulinase family protein [Spirochaetota bacterium]
MRLNTVIITIAALLCAFVPAGADTGDLEGYLKKHVVTRKLPNGITLIMLNRGFAPTLAFELAFRVGSADESYRTAGAAHMLEHMLFKGTDKLGTNDYRKEKMYLKKIEETGERLDRLKLTDPRSDEIPRLKARLKKLQGEHSRYVVRSPYDKVYTENGGVGFNASTSRDMTGYYIELPSSKLQLWAEIESERLRRPVLREYYIERENVMEERLMRTDSSGIGALYERFIATAFMSHPYRHPVIGWGSNIPYLSLRDVENFYWTRYIPSRMTITVVGRQDTDRTVKVIRKYFGPIKSRPAPPENTVAEAPITGERRFVYYFQSNPYLLIGWIKPAFPDPVDYTFEMIQEVLSGGKSSRLYRSLVVEKKIASSVSAWNGFPGVRDKNLFVVAATPQPSHTLEELEGEIYREMDRLKEDVAAEEMESARNRMESRFVLGLADNEEVAGLLSYFQTVYGDWQELLRYMEQIRRVTPADMKAAAERYLHDRNRVVGMLKDPGEGGGDR